MDTNGTAAADRTIEEFELPPGMTKADVEHMRYVLGTEIQQLADTINTRQGEIALAKEKIDQLKRDLASKRTLWLEKLQENAGLSVGKFPESLPFGGPKREVSTIVGWWELPSISERTQIVDASYSAVDIINEHEAGKVPPVSKAITVNSSGTFYVVVKGGGPDVYELYPLMEHAWEPDEGSTSDLTGIVVDFMDKHMKLGPEEKVITVSCRKKPKPQGMGNDDPSGATKGAAVTREREALGILLANRLAECDVDLDKTVEVGGVTFDLIERASLKLLAKAVMMDDPNKAEQELAGATLGQLTTWAASVKLVPVADVKRIAEYVHDYYLDGKEEPTAEPAADAKPKPKRGRPPGSKTKNVPKKVTKKTTKKRK